MTHTERDQLREALTHNIKCWPDPFEDMKAGRKTAEFRLNDRGYRVGDSLLIREWCPESELYTHREITRTITHVLADGYGLPNGYVMLSLAALASKPALDPATVEHCATVAKCAFDDRPRSRVGHYSQMDWEDGYREGTEAAAAAIRASVEQQA